MAEWGFMQNGTIKVTFLGAAGTVTGSKFLLETGKARVLIDCGLFQGLKELRLRNWERLGVAPDSLDAVLLTHAHLDHSGYLPLLVREGYSGPIFSTAPTRALCRILLPDSGRIQEEDAEYANRKGYSKHRPAKPLYSEQDANQCLHQFKAVDWESPLRIKDITVTFQGAGHILGAASLRIGVGAQSLIFSGDLGRFTDLLMPAPKPPDGLDTIFMESTYGDSCHSIEDPVGYLGKVIQETIGRGGTLIIPSFAVGRAQNIIFALSMLLDAGNIPGVPIYLDSPMATDVTRLYQSYCGEHALSKQECQRVFKIIHRVNSTKESIRLSEDRSPKIIISASGMLTGGRVLHHVAAFAGREENTICLVGYQAPGTRGADLLHGRKTLKIHGRSVPIHSEVRYLGGFSAHADQSELLQWLGGASRAPKKVFLIHGEAEASLALKLEIEKRFGYSVAIPQYKETLELS